MVRTPAEDAEVLCKIVRSMISFEEEDALFVAMEKLIKRLSDKVEDLDSRIKKIEEHFN